MSCYLCYTSLYKLFASWQLVGVKRLDLICYDFSDRDRQLTDGLGSYKYNDSMKSIAVFMVVG